MYLIVGLGNIGSKYRLTRHNIGFETVDYLAEQHGISINKEKFRGTYGQGTIAGEKVILLKPSTYMNASGECIRPFLDYFDIDLEDLIVIHDDVDFVPGTVKIRKSGGAGTHNGMKSVVQHVGSGAFPRIRIGVGNNKQFDLVDYVLGAFFPRKSPLCVNRHHRGRSGGEIVTDGIDAP
jgi:PTH1 family peptidyl-tRNA hydrolase